MGNDFIQIVTNPAILILTGIIVVFSIGILVLKNMDPIDDEDI